ncbi:calcium-binding protein, partial [Rhizobiaceae sp. 2RAB30]
GAGNDLFSLGIGYTGTINGGDGLDTVRLNGAVAPFEMALAGTVLTRVEVLDLRGGSIGLTASQLSAFATITNSANTNDRIEFYLEGSGSFDFSSRVGGALSVEVAVSGAAASVICTANADILYGRGEADILDGGAGADVFRGRAGSGAMKGSDGNDRFEIEHFDGAGRLDGGSGVDSLVALTTDLGSAV